MIQQELLIKHYEIALDELNQSVYKETNKVIYNLDKHKTSIGWKDISYKHNAKIVQGEYNINENVIYISDKFKVLMNKNDYNTELISTIKHHIISAYLFKVLKLDLDMITCGNFFFTGIVDWLNRNKPIGADDIRISNNDMELYNLYYKDIYTNHLDNEDFETFSELISYLKNRNSELKRQISKLNKEIFNKSNNHSSYHFNIQYKNVKETEIRIETNYSNSSIGIITENNIIISLAMYFEYKYVRYKCLELINRIGEMI